MICNGPSSFFGIRVEVPKGLSYLNKIKGNDEAFVENVRLYLNKLMAGHFIRNFISRGIPVLCSSYVPLIARKLGTNSNGDYGIA